jgi:hypothetical protein
LGGGEIAAEEAVARLLHLINIASIIRSLQMARRTRKAYQIVIEDLKEISIWDIRVQMIR